jgi:IclR family transcriptional regulator, pca regulon regulatory protein
MKKAMPARGASRHLASEERAKDATADFTKYKGNPDFVLSLARGLAVIEAFEGYTGGVSPSEIAQHTGFSRAAVRRLLVTLELLGYAETNGRLYNLKTSILKLGFSYLSSASLAVMAQPLTERLSEAVHESISVSVLDAGEIVYLARASPKRVMSIGLSIGSRLPAYCTSMGRVLLAALPEPAFDSYLDRVELKMLTPRTVSDKSQFTDIIRQVRSNGFALADQELELGLRSVAVPIQSRQGRVVAALNVGVHAARISSAELLEKFLPALRENAKLLGDVLP